MISGIKHRVVANLEVVSFGADAGPGDVDLARCPACGSATDLHQPDTESPERMLSVCMGCGHWHLILTEPKLGTTVVTLPLVAPLRDAWGQRDGTG